MSLPTYATLDGNEAVARVAYLLSEVIAIYPITPSSPMGEWSDAWAAEHRPNLWGTVPLVVEMQSEGGAAGTVHGALQSGALTTTFTASQGLMLMLPNMHKIAGELTAMVLHVAARSLAAQGLSIFGDHSDVMAARNTGFAMLSSNSVQEAHDFALIATATSFATRIPGLHFFDGFRTSHEEQKIELLPQEVLRGLIKDEDVLAHRGRALTPDRPKLRGTAQNPDVYFQARETVNPFYASYPNVLEQVMEQFGQLTGRHYRPYEYCGHPEAERVIVLMGSGAETAQETVDFLTAQGEKVGLLKVRLYRPFAGDRLVNALPKTVQKIAVLDRCKEPGSIGEPLYQDVLTAFFEAGMMPKIIGGRYGLSSKEFTPAMVKGVLDHLNQTNPKNHFTVGINDDLSHTSIDYDPSFSTEADSVVRAIFYGLGSDGTVGANKNSIKIIGEDTDNYAQGYFVYDSKKSGSVTVSHLRFGPNPILSTYLISQANFVACHQWEFLEQFEVLEPAVDGGVFLVNSPYGPEEIWREFPRKVQQEIIDKNLKVYTINANDVARDAGMGRRTNTVMQTCFFALAGVLPREEAIAKIKQSVQKTYGKKGQEIVEMNIKAVDSTLAHLYEVSVPETVSDDAPAMRPVVPDNAPVFVREVLGKIMARQGDDLPVSALPCDGTYPTATTQWEKRNVGHEIPVWDPDVCVQCGKCVIVCPHAVIRGKVYEEAELANAPVSFKFTNAKDHDWQGSKFTIQVAPEDCTGCGICVDVCPAKNKSQPRLRAINMAPQLPLREQERENWDFFLDLPNPDRLSLNLNKISHQQMQEPLFEFSGACAGCGETPYLKLVSQLFGDRMLVANATGCSSIYGGNLPTTPWAQNAEGRGPAWSNSLFEDNAEFGLGFRVAIDKQTEFAGELLKTFAGELGDSLVSEILNNAQTTEADIFEQRQLVEQVKQRLQNLETPQAQMFLSVADYLVKKSVWIIGGDGWAYDIGYGGLDHVLASGRNVNILVMDTEVYSNTGGQASKATPRAAVAKFAAGGKPSPKKDLGLMAMTYGNVYVASIAMGAKNEQSIKAFMEAEAYPGVSLIIAYSHCIAHGINMTTAMNHQKELVDSGRWLLYRYNPLLADEGKNPLQLDMGSPKVAIDKTVYSENRFAMLTRSQPEEAKRLMKLAQGDVNTRWAMYEYLAKRSLGGEINGNNHGVSPSPEVIAKSV
ncbi:pyruvate oxidoreductase [Synechocystis sp. PCC 6803]|uniref:Putative pyruvate-flavodoxin oxidoreductase n=1 Tax=Synechocystis sp. (strain ATCC 27184 / PCC 6803 / Kazusa) TaxID=1111708 RepID=NIFJ_SYNY3|nr:MULTISPECIES: pyruvate:ferredoxin (flavodoxin) oxidoreductase [unclassified Synechocystis]P52965.1 RecName: Full=Putative pyruvate-flavodoxin oxidoreductase [Synechocystis sp. PCC 6803 substr. Kazusa]BAM53630.1 pyruvate oxidoreductase [Synechocystis sp. PCC 6803] [Bacillus subtilis BEST7613]AGF53065.1 pyruvate oxidoreductase [Synechocystis sp. PCC 6803]ALJ68948.1 pyruvate-flavodoxin oxidoreductase [Synechocystis sp. PCC 6803]AVP90812.1 pyruvate:ferredoxin (flavodoxin) oxidoreductase [Synech